jgi:hypothetical protein
MNGMGRSVAALGLLLALGCQSLDTFDTERGDAYCGAIVDAQFVRTSLTVGGFQRQLRLGLEIDTGALTTTPGRVWTDDALDGPCAPSATFDTKTSSLRVTPEVVRDPLSTLTFEDGQLHNIVAWVDSTCRGPMLSIVSLYKDDRVEVRFLRPGAASTGGTKAQDAFARFSLSRRKHGCGY